MDRSEVVQKLINVFRQHGYEGATLSRIAQATGLKKATLYYHFPNGKQEMAQAVLEYTNQWFQNTILQPLHSAKEPVERIKLMSNRLSQFYDSGRSSCLLAIFTLGEPDNIFQKQVHQMFDTWIESLVQVIIAAGIPEPEAIQKAEDAIIQVQGALILARGTNNTKPFERVLQQLPVNLLSS
ncbi:MAG: TetR/AcrR family transcriptional regulator [Pleurocapsa sp.]